MVPYLKRHNHQLWFMGILAFGYMGGCAILSHYFPFISPDEIVVGVSADNFIHGRGIRYSLYDDIFAPTVYAFRGQTVEEGRPVYAAWVGLWTRIRPRNLLWLRLSTAAAGVLMVMLLPVTLGREASFGLRLWSFYLLLSNPVFWVSSCITGEHMLTAAGATTLLAWTVLAPTFRWKWFIAGLISGICVAIHPNSLAFGIGLIGFLCARSFSDWTIVVLSGLLGFLTGLIVSLSPVNWKSFVELSQGLYGTLIKPPLLSDPLASVHYLKDVILMHIHPTSYYLPIRSGLFQGSVLLFWGTLIVLALIAACYQWEKAKPYLWGVLATLFGEAALMARREMTYSLLILPFIIPLAAYGMESLSDRPWASRWVKPILVSMLGASVGLLILFIRGYTRTTPSISEFVARLEQLQIPADSKVGGPSFLWLFRKPEVTRDIGALTVSRYATGGAISLLDCLGQWKPDFICIDSLFQRVFIRQGKTEDRLVDLLGLRSAQAIGTLSVPGGPVVVYQLQWSSTKPSTGGDRPRP